MKKIRVFIEQTTYGMYSAYMPDDNKLQFGAIGEGPTPNVAREDFLAVVDAFRVEFPEEIADVEFDFVLDIHEKPNKVTLAAMKEAEESTNLEILDTHNFRNFVDSL